ncbi:MAG TPA: hypothetical protein PKE65_10250 [Rhizobiaceae bacterium]|nr:hypothetical protein [Rhizobiaceae bacterium]
MSAPARKPVDLPSTDELIKAYKQRLSEIIDRRPSGTRQRLADALGKHRSFVTQMTSTAYLTPVPARHLATIFSICHFSAEERERFLSEYDAAHPDRRDADAGNRGLRHVSLALPDLGDGETNRQFDEAVAEFAHRMAALMQDKRS